MGGGGGGRASETSEALDVEFTDPDLDLLLLRAKNPPIPVDPALLCSLTAWSTCKKAVTGGHQLSCPSPANIETQRSRASLLAPIRSLWLELPCAKPLRFGRTERECVL